jgi:signal recognition particle subunit SRP19
LKDYDHVILWLDYFNKNLSKRKGRRIAKEVAIYDPTIEELTKASKRLGLTFTEEDINSNAKFPRRPFVRSGYLMIPKTEKKSNILNQIAKKMQENRNAGKR